MCSVVTPWTVALQAPLSMESFRQEYWRELPFPSPGDRPNAGTESLSPVSPALADRFTTNCATWETLTCLREYRYYPHSSVNETKAR